MKNINGLSVSKLKIILNLKFLRKNQFYKFKNR